MKRLLLKEMLLLLVNNRMLVHQSSQDNRTPADSRVVRVADQEEHQSQDNLAQVREEVQPEDKAEQEGAMISSNT